MKGKLLLLFLATFLQTSISKNIFVINSYSEEDSDELISVVVLYRHGDRSPITSFPNDPYIDSSYWPEGYGQLLNKGKERQYELGQWFRKRYNTFLSQEYSSNEIRVVSTDVDRTLMSAAANLAGLYPPPKSQIWDEDLLWEPIPIHTKPQSDDAVLATDKECPRYNALLKEVTSSEYFKNLTVEYADFFKYVTEQTGRNTTTLGDISNLYSVFYVYRNHNVSFIPSWADSLDQKVFTFLAGIKFKLPTFTEELARLKVGPFFNYVIEYFDDVIQNVTDTPKFLMLSAHDTTVADALNGMEAFDYYPPEFSATVFWELRKSENGTQYVNVLYRRSTTTDKLEELSVRGCNFDCVYDDFKSKLAVVAVESSVWEDECKESKAPKYAISLLFLFVTLLFSFSG